MNSRPRLLFAGYRDWALAVAETLAAEGPLDVARDPEQLAALAATGAYPVIAVVGWSWKLGPELLAGAEVIGMHPSALPEYGGGSPVQHQIIDGLRTTQATLFRLTAQMDRGPILDREPISLDGHLDQVFAGIGRGTLVLLRRYLARWPDVPALPQPTEAAPTPRRRLTPAESCLSRDDLAHLSCRDLWNRIRAREDPYPNVYLEDETGRLTLCRVEFDPAPPGEGTV
jgi:methionyl-tRNA formyltransferase